MCTVTSMCKSTTDKIEGSDEETERRGEEKEAEILSLIMKAIDEGGFMHENILIH